VARSTNLCAFPSSNSYGMPNYPHMFPVQTGPGKDDWKVVMFPGVRLSSVGGDQSYEGDMAAGPGCSTCRPRWLTPAGILQATST
jgi:hypothetical protein